MNALELQKQLATAALPELIEVDGNFIKREIATIDQLENDLIRTVGKLRHMDANDPKAVEARSRVSSLWRFRNERLGGDDLWVVGVLNAVGTAPVSGDGPTAAVFDRIRADQATRNEAAKPRPIIEVFGRADTDPFSALRRSKDAA